jgi:hypothetical protein
MGARANCVIVERERPHIFYGRWAAIAIHAMLLSGPQGTIEQIRGMTPADQLTDTVWAEGGLVVNCDTQRVVYWGGECYHVPHVRRYAPLIWQRLWPGWNISWAVYGQPDIARACAIDPALVIETEFDDHAFLFGSSALLAPEDIVAHAEPTSYQERQVLSVRFPDGAIADYLLGVSPGADDESRLTALDLILTLGPALAERLPSLAPATLQREDFYLGGVALNFQQQTMLVWARWALDERKITALERRWPGWTVRTHEDGPVEHLALLARESSSFLVPKSECIQEMITAFIDHLPYAQREEKQHLLTQILQHPTT